MGWYDAPFVPTDENVVREMLKLAELKPGEILYDLGSGDGRIVVIAAKEFKARAVGIEVRKDLIKRSWENARKAGVLDKVRFINANFFHVDISEADVVTLFLLTSTNEKLRPKLESELKEGARVVSHEFEIRPWKPERMEIVSDGLNTHKLLLYRIKKE